MHRFLMLNNTRGLGEQFTTNLRRMYSYSTFSTETEAETLINGIRLGELTGVRKTAVDGCKVCNNIMGSPGAINMSPWELKWVQNHDGYDERNAGSGTVIGADGNCPLSLGKRCGKYCCIEIPPTEQIQ